MQPEPKIFPFSRPPSLQNVSANGKRSFSFFITCAACGTLSDALLEFFARTHIPIFGNVAVSQDRPSKHEGDRFSGTTFFTGDPKDMELGDDAAGRVAFFPGWRVRVFGLRKIGMLFRCLFRETSYQKSRG